MTRKANLDRPAQLCLKLPESLMARLYLYLYSELEGRVPKGSYQSFFSDRIVEFFDSKRLDLTAYGYPHGSYVSGPRAVIEALESQLKAGTANVGTVD